MRQLPAMHAHSGIYSGEVNNKPPSPPNKPTAAWINPPVPRKVTTEDTESREALQHGATRALIRTTEPFVGETERAIRRSRPKLPRAGSGGRVKGAKRDRSHAQRNEHGEDQPFDAPEHLATIVNGWPENLMSFQFCQQDAASGMPELIQSSTNVDDPSLNFDLAVS